MLSQQQTRFLCDVRYRRMQVHVNMYIDQQVCTVHPTPPGGFDISISLHESLLWLRPGAMVPWCHGAMATLFLIPAGCPRTVYVSIICLGAFCVACLYSDHTIASMSPHGSC